MRTRDRVGASVMAGAFGLALAAGIPSGVVGHPEGCQRDLVAAPIEDIEVPPGWILTAIEVDASGWHGRAEWSGGDFRVATFTLACTEEPLALLARRAMLRSRIGAAVLPVETPIGDDRVAYDRLRQEGIRLEWVVGDVFGTIVADGNASLAELAHIAAGLASAGGSDT